MKFSAAQLYQINWTSNYVRRPQKETPFSIINQRNLYTRTTSSAPYNSTVIRDTGVNTNQNPYIENLNETEPLPSYIDIGGGGADFKTTPTLEDVMNKLQENQNITNNFFILLLLLFLLLLIKNMK